MCQNYFKITPDLSKDGVVYIDDWEFTHWPNTPTSEIITNSDGTFSVVMEENFVPLVDQLQNLFKNGSYPEDGTYLGEAVFRGSGKPLDLIHGDFIKSNQGVTVSSRLLDLLRQFHLPHHTVYTLPLIKRKKRFDDYHYVYFSGLNQEKGMDILLADGSYSKVVCVSENLKEAMEASNIRGCEFTHIKV